MSDSPQRHMQWDGPQQLPEGLPDSYSGVNQLHPAHVHTPARTRTHTHTQTMHHVSSSHAHFYTERVLTSAGAPRGGTRTEPVDCCRSGDTRWGLRSTLQQKQNGAVTRLRAKIQIQKDTTVSPTCKINTTDTINGDNYKQTILFQLLFDPSTSSLLN